MPFTSSTASRAAHQSHANRVSCAACIHDGYGPTPLHSCETFPLPLWTVEYLAAFDRALSGEGSREMPSVILRSAMIRQAQDNARGIAV